MSETLNELLDTLQDSNKLGEPLEVLQAFEDWAESTGRSLYPHQREAAEHLILEDRHLIAPTPTGSGKSLIATAAILWALAREGVSFYTAPIKALVSEKFFELTDLFGAPNVGMITGDGSVNPEAPIICATAEILANQSLRWADSINVDTVVMDEFHYYTDPERGWAWQAPLLTLTKTRFVLLSATLGNTSFFEKYLAKHTGREVAVLNSVQRPVPLKMSYVTQPTEKLLISLAHRDQLPAYLVHSSQRAAITEAERIAAFQLDLGMSEDKLQAIKSEIKNVSFHSAFGKTLRPLLMQGIAVHHAGMLPRYRRLVERLAGLGLLKVISGTDTLGVGINVAIRTVVMTSLVKFDGSKERHLTAREFHQIAGRAGRAGFDTIGYVAVQAPQWEIENAAALNNAAGNPKKLAKLKKKAPEKGKVSWTEGTFERLRDSQPEEMTPRWKITHSMVLNTIERQGDQARNLDALATQNHNALRAGQQGASNNRFPQILKDILESLESSGVIRHPNEASSDWELSAQLPDNFALNQSLAPFALDYLLVFTDPACDSADSISVDENGLERSLDVISVVEAVLDDPVTVLLAQQRRARDTAYVQMKAAGLDYAQRQDELEKITYPRPLNTELEAAFETYSQVNPWVKGFDLHPKSVLRDMVEKGDSFSSYVQGLGISYSEGVLLRYLTDAYRALSQIVPVSLRSPNFEGILDWLKDTLTRVDSSLLDEWKFLSNPGLREEPAQVSASDDSQLGFAQRQDGSYDYRLNPVRLQDELFNECVSWLDALAGDEFEFLARMEQELRSGLSDFYRENGERNCFELTLFPLLGSSVWDRQLGEYWDIHDFMDSGASGRSKKNFRVFDQPLLSDFPSLLKLYSQLESFQERGLWLLELTIVDGDDDLDFGFYALADPAASDLARRALWVPLGLLPR